MLWLGNDDEGVEGERVFLAPSGFPGLGSRMEVMESTSIPGGVEVKLGWEPDACATLDSLSRTGDVRGAYAVPISARTAVDTVSEGESVTFRLGSALCSERVLVLTGRAPAPLRPGWDTGRIVLPIHPPLRRTPSGSIIPPRDVLLVHDGTHRRPTAVHILGEGTGLLIELSESDPDSLVIMGAWHTDGYPVGGSFRAAVVVPLAPPTQVPPVLAGVEYQASDHVIRVTMSGDAPSCDYQYRLKVPDTQWSHQSGDPRWPSFDLSINPPLDPGTYTLELIGECLPDPSESLGLSRSFVVGFVAYPNPIRSGDELILENLEPGSRIQLLDVSGREQLSWVVSATIDRRSLDIAPGLYFLRVQSPGGELVGLQKLGILR